MDDKNRPVPAPAAAQIDVLAAIFSAVADASAADRERLLDELCPDEAVRRQAVELLAFDSSTNLFIDQSPFAKRCIPESGASIGPYKLLQSIGQGGMGIVYMAEQTIPVRRRVALKLVKPGVDTKQVLARFDAERQALSMMDHPNIARVLDAGETDDGRPFFVMELVKGMAINSYCEQKGLTTRERLDLFVSVCQAVQHAHQKGIIHRDLKPSNVLVAEYDGVPVPKVIDFGVAKAINQPLTELTVFTGFGQIVGTFEYMSPEQSRFNQLDVDTRTDIYGLGVLLYELLTGSTPFSRERLREVEWDEMLRIIREEDPPIPSTRLSETARAMASESETQSIEPAKISRIVRGEVDWIVMKALEKDRERRYVSAQAMAEDIRCFLKGDPVAACPPTTAYRFRKFARRNRVALLFSLMIVLALVLGLMGTAWQAFRATVAEAEARAKQGYAETQQARAETSEREARTAAQRATAISRYLRNDLLGLDGNSTFFDPQVKFDPDLKLITLLERAQERLDSRFADRSEDQFRMQMLLIESYCSIGRYDVATERLRKMLAILSDQRGPTHASVLAGKKILVTLELQQGHWLQAKQVLEALLSVNLQESVFSLDEEMIILNNLATAHKMLGEYVQAEATYQRLYDFHIQLNGPESLGAMEIKGQLAAVKGKLGEDILAEKWLQQVIAYHRNQHPNSDLLSRSLQELGEFCLARNRYDEATQRLTEALMLRQQSFSSDPVHAITAKLSLATIDLLEGRLLDARQARDEFISYFSQKPELAQESTVEQIELHAQALANSGDIDAVEQLRRLADQVRAFLSE